MSGHYATLLRGTVEAMLPDHNVYITDWANARDVPLAEGPFTLTDYVSYLRQFLAFLGPGTHMMAVCQPSVPMLAAVSLMAEDKDPYRPNSMVMMGGPIRVSTQRRLINLRSNVTSAGLNKSRTSGSGWVPWARTLSLSGFYAFRLFIHES